MKLDLINAAFWVRRVAPSRYPSQTYVAQRPSLAWKWI
jgi:hypothetical protein